MRLSMARHLRRPRLLLLRLLLALDLVLGMRRLGHGMDAADVSLLLAHLVAAAAAAVAAREIDRAQHPGVLASHRPGWS